MILAVGHGSFRPPDPLGAVLALDLVRFGWVLLWAGVVMVGFWGSLVIVARRMRPGPLRELATALPNCSTLLWRLRRSPDVPWRAKVALGLAGLWVLSPIDLIPEFLPLIGPLDDVIVVALALRYAGRRVPRQTILDAWPGDPGLMQRFLGPPRRSPR